MRSAIFLLASLPLIAVCSCAPRSATSDANPTPKESVDPVTISGERVDTGDVLKHHADETTKSVPQAAIEDKGDLVIVRGDLGSVDWASLVGRQVTIEGDLVILETHDLGQRGRVEVARERMYVPTTQFDPNDSDPDANSFQGGSNVAKVVAAQKYNDSARLTIDDGSSKQNVFPPILFPELGRTQQTVRAGSVVNGVSGKVAKFRSKITLDASEPLQWTPAPRPSRPSVGDPDATVASFNVLNFFTTIDDKTNNARGADSKSELERQEAKIVAAIIELKADVIGLMELENNLASEQQLVAALNKELGKEVFKACGIPVDFRDAPGGNDEIRVGIIYRADRVSSVGPVSTIRDEAFTVARAPVVQTFQSKGSDKPFTVIVNHFKSKGASKANAENKNKGDGQGAYNAARRSQALAISTFIDEMETDSQPRVLVIGDLNAYQQEDPVDALRAKGLIDLHEQFESQSDSLNYSYLYRGQIGSLDHAFATKALATDVTGIATWHINADEPRILDYNEEYNPKSLFDATAYRSSDHDPVLIGIGN